MPVREHNRDEPWHARRQDRLDVINDRRTWVDHQSTLTLIGDHPGVGSVQGHRARVRGSISRTYGTPDPSGSVIPMSRRTSSRIAEPPATLGFHQLRQYWLDLAVNRLIDHLSHSCKISKLDQDRHRGRQHPDASGALGSQCRAGSRPIGMISLPGNVGRLLIIRHSRHEERRVIAARLDFRGNPVRPGIEICLQQHHTSLFRRLTNAQRRIGSPSPEASTASTRPPEKPPSRARRPFVHAGAINRSQVQTGRPAAG